MRRFLNHFLLLETVLFLSTVIAHALPADQKAKVYIVSDACIYNYKTGTSVFTGRVKVDQGTTHITADKLTTQKNAQNQIKETIAYGIQQLAHYWTLPKINDVEVHANAKIIKFFPVLSNVTLEQEATVTQGENSFHGQLIHYDFHKQTITVPASTKGRAVMIYNPGK